MADTYRVTCDLFEVPTGGPDRLLYAPRRGYVLRANADLVGLLGDLESVHPDTLNDEQRAVLEDLVEQGILNGDPDPPVVRQEAGAYAPTQVTLFPTNRCNLRCTYCYAAAGDFPAKRLSMEHATGAIDGVIENILQKKKRRLSLGFHGGGEPLLEWRLVQDIVAYAETRCAKEGLDLGVNSATNGVLSRSQCEWIIRHFKSLNISFDGLPDVQDEQRPLPGGKGSFPLVDQTLRFLDRHDFPYGIRSTISLLNVDRMEDCLEFIAKHYKTRTVHFEPLFYCGRCKTTGVMSPPMASFAEHYKRCLDRAATLGVKLTYSGSRLENLTPCFCGVSNDNFAVTPDGDITACFEVTSRDDPRAETFVIGRIEKAGRIAVDAAKRRALWDLTVDHLPYCKDCFAKWHCAGDCVTRIGHSDYAGPRGHERCLLNRSLLAHRLEKLLDGSGHGDGGDQPAGPVAETRPKRHNGRIHHA